MSSEQSKATVTAFLQALGQGQAERISSLVTEDATWWIGGNTHLSGTYSMAEFFGLVGRLFSGAAAPLEGRFYGMIAEGDRVAVESSGHLKFADGRQYDNFTHILFSLRDGRIAAVREYGDTEQLSRVFAAVGRNG